MPNQGSMGEFDVAMRRKGRDDGGNVWEKQRFEVGIRDIAAGLTGEQKGVDAISVFGDDHPVLAYRDLVDFAISRTIAIGQIQCEKRRVRLPEAYGLIGAADEHRQGSSYLDQLQPLDLA
jgi:hypothetical protein